LHDEWRMYLLMLEAFYDTGRCIINIICCLSLRINYINFSLFLRPYSVTAPVCQPPCKNCLLVYFKVKMSTVDKIKEIEAEVFGGSRGEWLLIRLYFLF